jgi:ornithine carbamoyltransferase
MAKKEKKDFLTLKDYSKVEIENILDLSEKVKKNKERYSSTLNGKNIALLFDKHSTRTRLSFEVGIDQLGGNSIYLDSKNLQLSRGETYQDTARILSIYLDGVVIRTFKQETVECLAKYGDIPVINGLTDSYHPCQVLSDLLTLKEMGMLKKGLKFTYMGDCNNMTNSLIIGLLKMNIGLTIGCPENYLPPADMIEYIKNNKQSGIVDFIFDPVEAAKDADVLYTDVWLSMGDKVDKKKFKELEKFQVNNKLMRYAKEGVKIMHCLPAHRGQEVTSEVLESKNSVVLMQAENRLHAQKGLLVYLFGSSVI